MDKSKSFLMSASWWSLDFLCHHEADIFIQSQQLLDDNHRIRYRHWCFPQDYCSKFLWQVFFTFRLMASSGHTRSGLWFVTKHLQNNEIQHLAITCYQLKIGWLGLWSNTNESTTLLTQPNMERVQQHKTQNLGSQY